MKTYNEIRKLVDDARAMLASEDEPSTFDWYTLVLELTTTLEEVITPIPLSKTTY